MLSKSVDRIYYCFCQNKNS